MKAQIQITEEDLAALLRGHLEARGLVYAGHSVTVENGVLVEADLGELLLAPPQPAPLPPAPLPPAPLPPAQLPRSPNPRTAVTLLDGELRGPSDDPDPESTDTSAPPPRSHPKAVDDDLADELARILAEDAAIREAKGKTR